MPLLSASLDTLLFTTLAVIPPLVYLLRRPASSSMPRPPLRSALSGLLILHTLYTLYTLIIDYPPNIFTALHIPLTTPADRIRAILLAHAGRTPGQPGAVLPPALESLLTRLASFDMRTIYVRYGQRAIQSCTYCRSDEDFSLHFLPSTLLQYVQTAALLGALTMRGSGRAGRRVLSVGILAAAAAFEAYWLLTVRIDIPRDGRDVTYWHDLCWTLRHVLFLLLPLGVHLLPLRASSKLSPGAYGAQTIPEIITSVATTGARLQALKVAQAAVSRDDELSARVEHWWARDVAEGLATREDPAFRRVAEKSGLGFVEGMEGEGKLREGVRDFVGQLVDVLSMEPQQ